jgi:phosphoribosylglycinamide formyltransferase-1
VLSLVVLISGEGSGLLSILKAASDARYPAQVVGVGADRDADGLAHAERYGVPAFTVSPSTYSSRDAWGGALLEEIERWKPDLVVCAGFMRVLPPAVVRALSPQIINIHPALLPKFPGVHAVRDALAAGVTETGATVHIVDEGVDTGPIVAQSRVPIEPGDTEIHLHERIKSAEHPLLVRSILDIAVGTVDLKRLASR